jgi:transcriptional regulator with PAS, ATPase and Fis domain
VKATQKPLSAPCLPAPVRENALHQKERVGLKLSAPTFSPHFHPSNAVCKSATRNRVSPRLSRVPIAGSGKSSRNWKRLATRGAGSHPRETGSGKEVLARKLRSLSARASRPFLKLNCAALPSELVESELFGYERGAFHRAFEKKAGIFELADGGTILLHEIATWIYGFRQSCCR